MPAVILNLHLLLFCIDQSLQICPYCYCFQINQFLELFINYTAYFSILSVIISAYVPLVSLFSTILSWIIPFIHFPYQINSFKAMHVPVITALPTSPILTCSVLNSFLKSKSACCLFSFNVVDNMFYYSNLFLDFKSPYFYTGLKHYILESP